MGLHLVLLAKLNLLSTSSQSLSPMVASLVWPFVLKLTFSFRLIRRTYTDVIYSIRLFSFQMGQIAFDTELGLRNTTRWERALRLVYERVTNAGRSPSPSQSDEDSLHALSMLAL
ncbi:hypothetical protein L1049_022582 [Liquidambar formosana]|uniref:Uncharacterized protein n=1 Tax=Liquidambar formosana TaxID=63359 RepID=A0AAP0WP71_LIQFO